MVLNCCICFFLSWDRIIFFFLWRLFVYLSILYPLYALHFDRNIYLIGLKQGPMFLFHWKGNISDFTT